MFHIENISEIKELSVNNDGTMRVSIVTDAKDYDNNTNKKIEITFPRFLPGDKFLSVPLSPDSMMTLQLEIDPLIGVDKCDKI